jgi:hypothetical protein
MPVPIDSIETLVELLAKVLNLLNSSKLVPTTINEHGETFAKNVYECADEVMELFPTEEGFFFGSTSIDEYYKQSVEGTYNIMNNILINEKRLLDLNLYNNEYYYHASW